MNPLVSAALDAICLERDDQSYAKSFDTAAALVKEFGESDIANALFAEIPRTVPFELVSELFNLLAWQTSDNGAQINRTCESWLRDGTDNRKLLIALHQDVYPFIEVTEMEYVLANLVQKNFRGAAQCN